MAYPVHITIEQRESYSRLTTFFRLLLAIPHLVVVTLWAVLVIFTVIAAWFAILFRARYPGSLFRFHQAFLSYYTRVVCYSLLLCDGFPSFGKGSPDDGYPVQVAVSYPERQSRLSVGFRILLAYPVWILTFWLNLFAYILAIVTWFVVMAVGRIPDGLFEVIVLPRWYTSRVLAYSFLLLTDTYPWFQEESDSGLGPVSLFDQPLPPPAAL